MPLYRIYLVPARGEAWKIPFQEVDCETPAEAIEHGRRLLGRHDSAELWYLGSLISRFGPDEEYLHAAASTFVFRFGAQNIWHIGHTHDIAAHLAEVNAHVPFEEIGQQWVRFAHRAWDSVADAHGMELRMLQRLQSRRTIGDRVRCSEGELQAAWDTCLMAIGAAEPRAATAP